MKAGYVTFDKIDINSGAGLVCYHETRALAAAVTGAGANSLTILSQPDIAVPIWYRNVQFYVRRICPVTEWTNYHLFWFFWLERSTDEWPHSRSIRRLLPLYGSRWSVHPLYPYWPLAGRPSLSRILMENYLSAMNLLQCRAV